MNKEQAIKYFKVAAKNCSFNSIGKYDEIIFTENEVPLNKEEGFIYIKQLFRKINI